MKKKNSARILMISVSLFVLFFIFQMCLFSTSSLSYLFNVSDDSTKPRQVKAISKQNPLNQATKPLSQTQQSRRIVCDRSHASYDICEINVPTVLDPTTSTFYVTDPTCPTSIQKIRPYPRKAENYTMSRIKEITLMLGPPSPKCQAQHESPALVFSAGGYTGNFFHEFSDGFIPLFLTVHSLFSNNQRDLILVISKYRDWWAHKYLHLLQSFTDHPIVDLDKDTVTHCFPSVKLGLISHGLMTINPNSTSETGKTLTLASFRDFLKKSYGQGFDSKRSNETRPRLVLLSRVGRIGRVLVNEGEVKKEAEKAGFHVVLFRPSWKTTLSQAHELMSSSHVVVGVHGAGLTHAVLFMRPGSTLIQIVPLGVDWLAEACFGKPAVEMGLESVTYMIEAHESSLGEKYGSEEMVISNPVRFRGKSWSNEIMNVYLKEQNVKLDLGRFRRYLKEAYRKAMKLMKREEDRKKL